MNPEITKPKGGEMTTTPPSSLRYFKNGVKTEGDVLPFLTNILQDVTNGKITVGAWGPGAIARAGSKELKVYEFVYNTTDGTPQTFAFGIEIPGVEHWGG